jgi:hypothetical protein
MLPPTPIDPTAIPMITIIIIIIIIIIISSYPLFSARTSYPYILSSPYIMHVHSPLSVQPALFAYEYERVMGVTASAAAVTSVDCDFQGSIRQYVGKGQVCVMDIFSYYDISVGEMIVKSY